MPRTPYIFLGDKQESSKSSLANAVQELLDEFVLTDKDLDRVKEILKDNDVTFEE